MKKNENELRELYDDFILKNEIKMDSNLEYFLRNLESFIESENEEKKMKKIKKIKNKIKLIFETEEKKEIEIFIDSIKLKMIEESLNHFIYSSIFDDIKKDYKDIFISFNEDILIINKMIESDIILLEELEYEEIKKDERSDIEKIKSIEKNIKESENRINEMKLNIQELNNDYDGLSEIEIREDQIKKLKDIKEDYDYYFYHDDDYYEEINDKNIFQFYLEREIKISEEILERLEIELEE